MKKHVFGLFLFAGCVVLGASGCAKNEMVKKDESIASSSGVTKAVQATAPPAKLAPVKAEMISEPPVSSPPAAASQAHEQVAPVSQAAELRASLQKIYFDFDAYTLSKEARDTLGKDADLLKKDPNVKVQIEGHCDERGSDEYNLALGEKRARAATQYLISMGIPADRLSVISYGKEKPAEPGHNEAAFARNRRDEFVVPNR